MLNPFEIKRNLGHLWVRLRVRNIVTGGEKRAGFKPSPSRTAQAKDIPKNARAKPVCARVRRRKEPPPRGPCAGLLSTNGSPAALCARVRWTKGRLSHRPSALLAGVRARAGLRMSGSMTPGDLGVNHRPGLSSTASRFTSFGGWHPLAKSGRFYLSIIAERGPVYAGRDTNAARDRPIAQGR